MCSHNIKNACMHLSIHAHVHACMWVYTCMHGCTQTCIHTLLVIKLNTEADFFVWSGWFWPSHKKDKHRFVYDNMYAHIHTYTHMGGRQLLNQNKTEHNHQISQKNKIPNQPWCCSYMVASTHLELSCLLHSFIMNMISTCLTKTR